MNMQVYINIKRKKSSKKKNCIFLHELILYNDFMMKGYCTRLSNNKGLLESII